MQDSSREQGQIAAALCVSKAQRVSAFSVLSAAGFIAGALAKNGPMSGESLVNEAKKAGFEPHDDRAFGSVFSLLARRNVIRCSGFCERIKGHKTAGGRVWEAVSPSSFRNETDCLS